VKFPGRGNEGAPAHGSANARDIKRRQMATLAAILLLAGGAIIASIVLLNSRKPPAAPVKMENPVSMTAISVPGAAVSEKDAWKGQEAAKIALLEKKLQELQERSAAADAAQVGSMPGRLPPGIPAQQFPLPPVPPPPPPMPVQPPRPPVMPPAPPQGAQTQAAMGPVEAYQDDGIETGTMDDAVPVTGSGGPVDATKKSGVKHTSANYLTSGTFVRAQLLSGLDAPTGGQAQSNPQPVLMRLIDDGRLPNRFRARMKECLIVGTGYGDLSSERAIVRTESLACVTHGGEALDQPIKGFVAGEDGKAGIRGRLVTKQGQLLANALIAGIGSGLGQAFQQNSTITSTSALGTTTSIEPGKQFQAGVVSGVGKAFDRLAQYYITLAEKLFPVIEVGAGRVVDVVLTKGTELPMGEADDAPLESRYGVR